MRCIWRTSTPLKNNKKRYIKNCESAKCVVLGLIALNTMDHNLNHLWFWNCLNMIQILLILLFSFWPEFSLFFFFCLSFKWLAAALGFFPWTCKLSDCSLLRNNFVIILCGWAGHTSSFQSKEILCSVF